MRLIDADALINESLKEGAYGYVDTYQIANAPTVDAVPVVRCKDCKWFEPEDEDGDCWCYYDSDITFRDGYCSWGKRRKDEIN